MNLVHPPRPALLVTIVAALALAAGAGCGGGGPAAPRGKVLLIGLDGAEWSLIRPMLAAGEMPNLARLMERGVHGNLRSLEPLAKSPAIWTTIATGRTPDEHGIGTFVDERNDKVLTQNLRRVRAIWNILSGLERKVGVVGWLQSWPAEEVNGFLVSDYLQYGPGKGVRVEQRTWPPGLDRELEDRVVPWERVPWSAVQRFLDAPLDTVRMSPNLTARLRPVRMYFAADVTFARIGLDLYRRERPDLFAVYLRGMDTMGHLYWNCAFPSPDLPPDAVDPELAGVARGAMRAYYRFTDELIGPIIDAADEETTILIVSDHGFRGGAGRGVEAHTLDGILVMAGRGVGRGEITGATVYDVTPTVLALLGLPAAENMKGKVLWAALGEEIPRDRFTARIPTWETGEPVAGAVPVASPVDEEIKERLRSLGYID